MLHVSFELLVEGRASGSVMMLLGILFSAVLMYMGQMFDGGHNLVEELKGEGQAESSTNVTGSVLENGQGPTIAHSKVGNNLSFYRTAILVGVFSVHAVGEGAGLGVAFHGCKGWLITFAIGLHNIPEGLALVRSGHGGGYGWARLTSYGVLVQALILQQCGLSVGRAVFWCIISALPQSLVALPAYLLANSISSAIPFGMGLGAGSMLWALLAEVVPECLKDTSGTTLGFLAVLGILFQETTQNLFDSAGPHGCAPS